ncbi:MAG: hypothetical protein Q9172_005561 [Xanthocarpia lactea]
MRNCEVDNAEEELSMDDHYLSTGSRGGICANVVLHFAVRHNAWDLADYSLDHGADVNSILEGDSGNHLDYGMFDDLTPLQSAVDDDLVDMAKLLVRRGADIEAGPWQTPLFMAVINGSTHATSFLLSSGANVEARDSDKKTPLMSAATYGSVEVVQLLLKSGAAIEARDISGRSPLIHAIRSNNLDIVQLLLNFGAAVEARDDSGRTPLMHASLEEELDIVQLLLKSGAAVEARDDSGRTPLIYAIICKNLQIVQLLLRSGAAVEARDNTGTTPLMYATIKGRLDIVQLLLKLRATVDPQDSRGATALHYAASWPEALKSLIRAGADVGARDTDGKTALHRTHRVECIDLLLNGGLEVDDRDKRSETPLHKASQDVDQTLVEYLLKRGASPSAESFDGTPLHKVLSAKYITNYFSVVQILLEYGADTNARRPSDGMTPVHVEALGLRLERLKDLEVLRLLCNHGADPYLINNESKTAFDYLTGHEGGISVLRSSYRSQLLPQLE